MDGIKQRLKELCGQYRWALLVAALGVGFMLIPADDQPVPAPAETQAAAQPDAEEQLERILAQIQGVGRVEVLLTVARGAQTLYVYDEDSTGSENAESSRREAVVITDEDRTQSGLVCQVLPPVYQGAVIVCQGGDRSDVRLAVVEAVCDATGLTADKISVWKMK